MTKKIKLVYPSSDWASNIGNPFFNLGMEYVFETASKIAGVELAIMPSASNPQKSFKLEGKYFTNSINYATSISGADILVLAGPMFDLSFGELFGGILENAKRQEIKVFLVSTGGINYTQEEVDHCRSILAKYPPFMLTTRDSDTFNNYGDLADYSYDAICGAWFAPDYYEGYDTDELGNYVTMTFDHTLEPKVNLEGLNKYDKTTYTSIKTAPTSHSTIKKIRRLFQRNLPETIDGFKVIRPNHCTLNRPNWRLAFKPNTFISQTPYGYLNMYRNTSFTLTDRLHASVATLAYGNPARLIIRSQRVKLLERIKGATKIIDEPSTIDMNWLRTEKEKYISWFSEVIKKL